MKRVWVWILVGLLALGTVYALVNKKQADISGLEILNTRQVTKVFAQEGWPLNLYRSSPYAGQEVNGVLPACYKLAGYEDQVLIYEYIDYDAREKAAWEWEAQGEGNGSLWFPAIAEPSIFAAKNILIIYISAAESDDLSPEELKRPVQIMDLVFYKLNSAQQMVFAGEGANWQGQVTYDYYLNWLHQGEKLEHDAWHFEQSELAYKGPDSLERADIIYSLESPLGGAVGTLVGQDGKNHWKSGRNSGSGVLPPREAGQIITVQWKGQAETFELKATE